MVVIDLVRHAEGHHNVCVENLGILDPHVTLRGAEQCAALRASYPYHDRVRALVASSLRRTLETCELSFGSGDLESPHPSRIGRILAVPEFQELSRVPSDCGSPPDVLRGEFSADAVDLSRVYDGWDDKSHGTPMAAELSAIEARAAKARRILRELAQKENLGPDDRIVVVTHGGFLHFLTEEYEGITTSRGTGWANAEWRSYVFADPSGMDEACLLRETPESWKNRQDHVVGLSDQERMELDFVFRDLLGMEHRHAETTGGLVRCKAAIVNEARLKGPKAE